MKVMLKDGGQVEHEELVDLLKEQLGVEVVLEKPGVRDRLAVKSGGRVLLLRTGEIRWIGAEHNYARLYTDEGEYLVRETMGKLERQLDAGQFRRIHRSTIVNVRRIRVIEPWMRGDAFVVLDDGQRLTASRNYRDRLREWIG